MSNEPIEKLEPMLVRLPPGLRKRLRERAHEEERTQAQVLRRALRRYLDDVGQEGVRSDGDD